MQDHSFILPLKNAPSGSSPTCSSTSVGIEILSRRLRNAPRAETSPYNSAAGFGIPALVNSSPAADATTREVEPWLTELGGWGETGC